MTMKRLIFLAIVAIGMVALHSCSQEDEQEYPVAKKVKPANTLLYANVDAEDYTREVLYMIKKSNVDLSDGEAAYRGIQVAYASILLSQSMTYTKVAAQ